MPTFLGKNMMCPRDSGPCILLLAPKKQGIVTSFRSIKKKRKAADGAIGYFTSHSGDDDDEYEKVAERKAVTFGVDLARLEEWLKQLSEKPL